jgi:Glycosyl transferase family 2
MTTETLGEGVTVVMPAFREEANLSRTVEDMLATLDSIGEQHVVVIVNDGSDDRTGDIADGLAMQYPGRVRVVHHQVNMGYGAAVRTGIATALEHTDAPWIFLTDADGQFKADELPLFISEARTERADAVIGFRPRRADPAIRKINAWLWTHASMLLLGTGARDVDCAYKLVRRRVLTGIQLQGDAALISPELLMKIRGQGARVLQRPVQHYPRMHGEQTGAKLSVILVSVTGLLRLWVKRMRDARPHERRRWPDNRVSVLVVSVAAVLSVLAYLHFYPGGQTIAYNDAKSHLMLARRVFFADTPGAGQLGGVWLPLPHIFMLPLIWNDWAFYSGFAGSVVMMICYVIGTLFAYKLTWRLTDRHGAALVAAAVFALNPNLLYMQSTPMTELLMFTTMLGSVYGLLRWIQTDDSQPSHHLYLLGAGLSALLCALTRYEGWIMAVTLTGVVLYGSLARLRIVERLLVCGFLTGGVVVAGAVAARFGLWGAVAALPILLAGYQGLKRLFARIDWHPAEGHVLAFGILGASAPLAWMIWNWAIFGDPLAFQNGPYAKPSNWVGTGELAVHHLGVALRTYEIAVVDNLTVPVAILGVLGLALYLWQTRLSAESLPALSLVIMFPMFVSTLYKGERPLHVPEYYGSFYNVRFGLVMLLPACLFVGYLVGATADFISVRWPSSRASLGRAASLVPTLAVVTGVVIIAAMALRTGDIVTLKEPVIERATLSEQHKTAAASWLRAHYTGGLVLMESYGNEVISFQSHIPLEDQVYEGSYQIWTPSLADPRGHDIVWIVMRAASAQADDVDLGLYHTTLLDGYQLVYSNHDYLVYKWHRTAAQLVADEQQ